MKMKRLVLVMLALLCVVLAGCKNEQKEIPPIELHDPILCEIATEPDIYSNMSSEAFIKVITDDNYNDTIKFSDDDLCFEDRDHFYKAYLIEKKFVYVEVDDKNNSKNSGQRLVYFKNGRIKADTRKVSDFESFIRKYS